MTSAIWKATEIEALGPVDNLNFAYHLHCAHRARTPGGLDLGIPDQNSTTDYKLYTTTLCRTANPTSTALAVGVLQVARTAQSPGVGSGRSV